MRRIFIVALGWMALALVTAKVLHMVVGRPLPWVYIPFVPLAVVSIVAVAKHKERP